MDEEAVLMEEQIASLQADVEGLQTRLAEAEALAAGRGDDLTRLRHDLDEARGALTYQEAESESLRTAIGASEERSLAATERYRELILAREPELPVDLVIGSTVDEVDAAVERARQTVSQVRQQLESQAKANRVPAGAPARTAPDTSALSPAEKIRLGLQQH